MKYKVEKFDGKWIVVTKVKDGEKYGYTFDNEQEAKQKALVLTLHFHQNQIDKAWKELQKVSENDVDGDVKLVNSDHFVTLRDLLY